MRFFKYGSESRPYSFTFALLVCAALLALPSKTQAQADKPPQFQIIILNQDWNDLQLGYRFITAQPNLNAADKSNPLFTIGLEEIESYDWTWQAITLTPDATTRLIDVLPISDKEGVRSLIDLKESLGWGNPLENALYIHSFVVMVNGEMLYGGIFLDPMSQMAIDFPVIRISLVNGQAVLYLLPVHIPFVNYDPFAFAGTADVDSAINEVVEGDWSQFSDEFKSGIMSFGNTFTAVLFRGLIRDAQIKDALLASSKLIEVSPDTPPIPQ
ncbi:MAG: hypothetical protein HY862_10320 [Chloroflexi bacterium]|nr:hypothetical protein [Chloroflexota bacterium]